MAHPKSRISKQRKRKRRTHYKASVPSLTVCQTTGETHQPHRAYFDADGNMFYNGNMLVKAPDAVEEEEETGDEGDA